MENTVGTRIELIRKSERLDIQEFMLILETSKTAYYGWKNGDYFPGSDVIIKLLLKFPQYSAEWLLLGHGEMKKSSNDYSTVNEGMIEYKTRESVRVEMKKIIKEIYEKL